MNDGRFDHFLKRLGDDLAVFPHQLDLISDRALLVDIPLTDQSTASFLDQRALDPHTPGAWFAWPDVAEAARALPAGAPAYILHVGHCGSTLLSRLVELAAGGRALREPLPLRTLSLEAADAIGGASLLRDIERRARLGDFERVWARGRAVVKATSMCNGLIDELNAAAAVAFVFLKPETYLATLLAGENAFADLKGFAQMRYRRLSAMASEIEPLSALSPGRLAGLAWLVETASIAASKRAMIDLDFDEFLREPVAALKDLCAHLGFPAADEQAAAALAGPVMRRYAKAPEHPYDAALRTQILGRARHIHAAEIAAGLKWIEATARGFPAGAAAIERFGI